MEAVDVVENQRDRNQRENGEQGVVGHKVKGQKVKGQRLRRASGRAALAVLDDDAFEKIRDVLASIGRRFEKVQNLLPLDHDNRISLLVEQRDDRILVHAVGFALELIDPRGKLRDPVCFLERAECFTEAVGRIAR